MISHVVIHPDYKNGQYHHDIALAILKTPLNYTRNDHRYSHNHLIDRITITHIRITFSSNCTAHLPVSRPREFNSRKTSNGYRLGKTFVYGSIARYAIFGCTTHAMGPMFTNLQFDWCFGITKVRRYASNSMFMIFIFSLKSVIFTFRRPVDVCRWRRTWRMSRIWRRTVSDTWERHLPANWNYVVWFW